MTFPETDVLTGIVSRLFRVDEVTLGDPKRGFIARYRGQLLREPDEAYDQLAEALRAYNITPLFRLEGGRQTVLLMPGVPRPKAGRISTNILLFVLTLLSVLFAGAIISYSGPVPDDPVGVVWTLLSNLWAGWPFAASLLSILLAHEFGHYFAGKAHGVAVSLPYFIPFPLPPLGTMGAFIQMKSMPRNKRALLDLAIAGPLAGLAVAVPVLLYGLSLSHLARVEAVPGAFAEGNSILYLLAKYLVFGQFLPAPPGLDGLPLLQHWVGFFFLGRPSPVGSLDVFIHPVALAGWAGLLVTFLNLIPVGQLDGGHVLYALFGERVRKVLPVALAVLLLLGFFWSGWWLWAGLIFLLGRSHAQPLDQITPLDLPRKALAAFLLLVFLLVLTPVPFIVF